MIGNFKGGFSRDKVELSVALQVRFWVFSYGFIYFYVLSWDVKGT